MQMIYGVNVLFMRLFNLCLCVPKFHPHNSKLNSSPFPPLLVVRQLICLLCKFFGLFVVFPFFLALRFPSI